MKRHEALDLIFHKKSPKGSKEIWFFGNSGWKMHINKEHHSRPSIGSFHHGLVKFLFKSRLEMKRHEALDLIFHKKIPQKGLKRFDSLKLRLKDAYQQGTLF